MIRLPTRHRGATEIAAAMYRHIHVPLTPPSQSIEIVGDLLRERKSGSDAQAIELHSHDPGGR
jgi:hypothetical protein